MNHKDDCNLVKPKIRSLGSFKKQDIQLEFLIGGLMLLLKKPEQKMQTKTKKPTINNPPPKQTNKPA